MLVIYIFMFGIERFWCS